MLAAGRIELRSHSWRIRTAVALAFEEMRTPCAMDEKFAYKNSEMQRREIGQRPSNDSVKYNVHRKRCTLSFHKTRISSVIVCLVQCLRLTYGDRASFCRTVERGLKLVEGHEFESLRLLSFSHTGTEYLVPYPTLF